MLKDVSTSIKSFKYFANTDFINNITLPKQQGIYKMIEDDIIEFTLCKINIFKSFIGISFPDLRCKSNTCDPIYVRAYSTTFPIYTNSKRIKRWGKITIC